MTETNKKYYIDNEQMTKHRFDKLKKLVGRKHFAQLSLIWDNKKERHYTSGPTSIFYYYFKSKRDGMQMTDKELEEYAKNGYFPKTRLLLCPQCEQYFEQFRHGMTGELCQASWKNCPRCR